MTTIRRRGLTLVELIITISLAAIIGIPVGILLSEHLAGALRARDATVAMNLARYELEKIDSLNNFCDPSLNLVTTTIDPYQGLPYALTRIVSCRTGGTTCDNCNLPPSNANNGVKQIQIQVRKSGSSEILATLISYRTKYVNFGP